METISQRIIKIVNALGGNKSEFARRINLTPAYISKLDKKPDMIPSDRTITDIIIHQTDNMFKPGIMYANTLHSVFLPETKYLSIRK